MENYTVEDYLKPGVYIDSDHPDIIAFAREHAQGTADKEKAQSLFLAVRDGFRYDPYGVIFEEDLFKASTRVKMDRGFCIHKAILLTAVLRAAGIPARITFADVRNHLNSKKLAATMGTDVFRFHGITEVYLNGRWLKMTPTFNKELCDKLSLKPLEFDGEHDCIFHPYDKLGHKHMEYLRYYDSYFDFPYNYVRDEFARDYPHMFDPNRKLIVGDFHEEAECG